jgi:fimbrial chaperone protein
MRNLIMFAALAGGAGAGAHASTFNISPIRANLSGTHRTEALTIVNAEDAPVVVQVRVLRWSQQDGEEHFDDTRDVLATPPVLKIAGNGEQIVRVAVRRDPEADRELSYRVIFEEIPEAAPLDFNGLRVALRLSVPIFVAPARIPALARVSWQFRRLANGRLEVTAANDGTGHLQVTDFVAQLAGSEPVRGMVSKYILPGSRMSWTFMPPGDAAPQGPIVIHGHSDQGDFAADALPTGQ